jgi:predicted  nucleic acid-binding Zn-ribbon protein
LKELNNQVIEVKKEIENINDRCNDLNAEYSKLDLEKIDLEGEIRMNA